MLTAASVLAFTQYDFDVIQDFSATSTNNTEGYNYITRIYPEVTGSSPDLAGKVSWEVRPKVSWLTSRLAQDQTSLIIEGRLPAYVQDSEDGNEYTIHVIAHVSGDVDSVDSEGNPVYDEDDNPVFISGDISADVGGGEGIIIDVVSFDTRYNWLDRFEQFVSYDTDAEGSVTMTFKTSVDLYPNYVYYLPEEAETYAISYDEYGNDVISGDEKIRGGTHVLLPILYASGDIEFFRDNFDLPSWLSYEVLSVQQADFFDVYTNSWTSGDVFVKELRIFRNDSEPAGGTFSSVRINGGSYLDYAYRDMIDPDHKVESYDKILVIGWDTVTLKF